MGVKHTYISGEELPAADVNSIVQLMLRGLGFGNSEDGSKTISADTDLDPTSFYRYSDLTIDVTKSLGVDTDNVPLVIRVEGDAEINGIINLDENGAASDAGDGVIANGTAIEGGGSGSGGTTGVNWGGSGGAGGGASMWRSGSNGSQGGDNGGAKGAAGDGGMPTAAVGLLAALGLPIACGGAGGTGGANGDAVAGTAGQGGGALYMLVGGDLTLGASSSITCDAGNGGAGTGGTNNATAGGGGGGGGGTVIILVAGTITDNGVTLSASAGSAGSSSSGAGSSGAGGAGKIVIMSLKDGTIIQS